MLPKSVAHNTGQQKSEMMLHTATSCNTQLQLATMSSNIRIEKTCEVCGIKYIAKKAITRSYSLTCARLLYKLTKRDEKIEAAIRKETVVKPFNPSMTKKMAYRTGIPLLALPGKDE